MNLESRFQPFRNNIVGIDADFDSPYGRRRILYADWIASGRLYRPIESTLIDTFGPLVGNTHSESSETGRTMTEAYHLAHQIIKRHVNADADDVIITTGAGMTSALAKFQRILGIKVPEQVSNFCDLPVEEKPIVFVTHMEHHSNHTPWLESLADVVVIEPDDSLLVDPAKLETAVAGFAARRLKIGSFSACSNVTGIETPYHELARIMHAHGGYCFVDFAASAPYVSMDMHPADPEKRLDAIFFSPHKFLGGPGSSGVLIFCRGLYKNRIPDHPGGGTVMWTNPWGEHAYVDDIEIREDGGTPGFLQAIRAALSIRLKERMTVEGMRAREGELVDLAFEGLIRVPGLHILAGTVTDRLGVFSFYIDGIHHNLIVRLLNDRFGIQVRGGCSCAGTYGHFLLNVDRDTSHRITEKIRGGDLSTKPGWVRMSLHPTTTDAELRCIVDALQAIVGNVDEWKRDYAFSPATAEFHHRSFKPAGNLADWFDV